MLCYLGLIILAVITAWIFFRRKTSFVRDMDKKCVLVTGCDTGFGKALIEKLHQVGVFAFAGCYTEDGLQQFKNLSSNRIIPLRMDVTSTESIKAAHDFVCNHLTEGTEFWGIVNNAGTAEAGNLFEFTTMEQWRSTFDVNLFGMVEVTKYFLPLIKKSKGRVVNMSSASDTVPIPSLSGYASSKFAVRGFSNCLRMDMARWGVKVCTIEPGFFTTNILNADITRARQEEGFNNAPKHIQEEYGEEFKQNIELDIQTVSEMASTSLDPVVDAYMDALFAQEPRIRYPVGSIMDVITMYVLPMLPEWLADRLVLNAAAYKIKPAALK